jgi:uncharacterized paraquat-inducible protein A
MKTLRRLLVILGITQSITNINGVTKNRYNPYNPLSYIVLFFTALFMVIYALMNVLLYLLSGEPFRYQ